MNKYKQGSAYRLPTNERAELIAAIMEGLPGNIPLSDAKTIAWNSIELVAKWLAEEEDKKAEPELIPYETNS